MDKENKKRSYELFTQEGRTAWRKSARENSKKNLGSEITKRIPRITLYSSARRRSSINCAIGNGFACDLPGILLSDIRTILFDFLFLQIINFTCNDRIIIIIGNNVVIVIALSHVIASSH